MNKDSDHSRHTAQFGLYRECSVQHCTVLYCTVLYCTVLYCTVLSWTALYCTALYCTVLSCPVLHCTVLYCTVLSCPVLHCTVLYSTVRSVIIGVKEHFSHTTSKMSFIILLWGKISTKISERLLLHINTYWIIILFRMFCFYFTFSSPFNSSFCVSSGTEDPWTWKIVEKYVPFYIPFIIGITSSVKYQDICNLISSDDRTEELWNARKAILKKRSKK